MGKLAKVDPNGPGLLSVERARLWLAKARSVDEVKQLRDKAEAIARYQRKQVAGREAAIDADVVVVWAERRIGQLTAQLEKLAPKSRPRKKGKMVEAKGSKKAALAAQNISKQAAQRYEAAASIPEKEFEAAVEKEAKRGKRVTTRRIVEPRRRAARNAKLAAAADEITPDVGKRCAVFLVDPPWEYEQRSGSHDAETGERAIENQYPTVPLEQLKRWNVDKLVISDAIMFMWATSPKLAEAIELGQAWGFTYRTCMVWDKEQIGMGFYARQQHELLLIWTRGNAPTPAPADRPASVVKAKRGRHSAKPPVFYDIIERMYPDLPKGELFARKRRPGWLAWGNET